MATYDNNENNGLYFIVGGLVVLALIGFFVFAGDDTAPENISPAAGDSYIGSTATDDVPDRTSSTELRIEDDNGSGVTSTTTETDQR